MSFSEQGKRATVYESCTLPVCELLCDEKLPVLDAVTLTLASFTQLKLAKREVIFELDNYLLNVDGWKLVYWLSYWSVIDKELVYIA